MLAVARTAARTVPPSPIAAGSSGFDHDGAGQVVGATVDSGDGEIDVAAGVVVNAAGVWSRRGAQRSRTARCADTIRPAKGVHLTLPWSLLRNDIAAVIPVPGDKRSLFVVPWGRQPDGTFTHTYIGTTDTDYDGRLDDPPCTSEDIDYVLGAVNAAIGADITADDVTGVWAGLRPLVRSASSARAPPTSRAATA